MSTANHEQSARAVLLPLRPDVGAHWRGFHPAGRSPKSLTPSSDPAEPACWAHWTFNLISQDAFFGGSSLRRYQVVLVAVVQVSSIAAAIAGRIFDAALDALDQVNTDPDQPWVFQCSTAARDPVPRTIDGYAHFTLRLGAYAGANP